ncbi:hypothetical protein BpHYR1_033844, partial [Brachionus plicatilis]
RSISFSNELNSESSFQSTQPSLDYLSPIRSTTSSSTEKESFFIDFRVILEKIIKLSLSRRRSLIVGDTNLTSLESELIRLIPNSVFTGYLLSNDLFVDASIITELRDQTEITSFIQEMNRTLIDNQEKLNEATPNEFVLTIEKDFGVKIFKINEDGSEQEVGNTTRVTATITLASFTSSINIANIISYKLDLHFLAIFILFLYL